MSKTGNTNRRHSSNRPKCAHTEESVTVMNDLTLSQEGRLGLQTRYSTYASNCRDNSLPVLSASGSTELALYKFKYYYFFFSAQGISDTEGEEKNG